MDNQTPEQCKISAERPAGREKRPAANIESRKAQSPAKTRRNAKKGTCALWEISPDLLFLVNRCIVSMRWQQPAQGFYLIQPQGCDWSAANSRKPITRFVLRAISRCMKSDYPPGNGVAAPFTAAFFCPERCIKDE